MKISAKLSTIKRLICLALSVILVAGFVPAQAKAADAYIYKVSTLPKNTSVSAIGNQYEPKSTDPYSAAHYEYNYTYNMYKIIVPANGFIKINVSRTDTDVRIYKKVNRGQGIGDNYLAELSGKKAYYVVLDKGTYYLNTMYNARLRWNFTNVKNRTNYCRPRAIALRSNLKIYTTFRKGYEHDQWFKIKLTSKKKITVTLKQFSEIGVEVKLYNAKGKYIKTTEISDISYRTAKLPKGTYFIRLQRWDERGSSDGFTKWARVCQLSWK